MNIYIKFMKFNKLLIKFCVKSTLNFINFHEKYIKFYTCIQIYFLVINTLNL